MSRRSGHYSAVNCRTTRAIPATRSPSHIRKRVEEAFGGAKEVAGLSKMRHRGLPKGRLAIHPRQGSL